jgi:hypothetical protein
MRAFVWRSFLPAWLQVPDYLVCQWLPCTAVQSAMGSAAIGHNLAYVAPAQVEGRGPARMDQVKQGDKVLTLAQNGSLAYQ